MINDWSGSIIYEWIEETNDYGLVSYGPAVSATATGSDIVDGYTRSGTPTPVSPDFSNLKTQWATLTPTGVAKSDMNTGTLSTRACPASTSGTAGWLVAGDVALPTIGETLSSTAASGSATGTGTDASSSSTSTSKSPANPNSRVTKMGAGLVGVMLLFMICL